MKVEIVGKFFDNHSLSIINRYIAIELDKLSETNEVEVCITPIDKLDPSFKVDKKFLKKLTELSKDRNPDKKVDIQIRHTYPPMWVWPNNPETKVIYIQPWEFSRVPFEWQYKFETFADHVIVPSTWVRDRYLEGGINPSKITVIPNGYNPEVFNKEGALTSLFDNKKFTFTFVGCGQFRKGIDVLIDTFKEVFVKADAVRLFIKDSPQIYGNNNLLHELTRIQYYKSCAEIILNDDSLSEEEMAQIYRSTDVLVHPYRGEGFGMHVQEAMACGAFPLITGGGPTDDFVNEECGLRINSSKRLVNFNDEKIFATKPGDSLTNMGSHGWVLEPDATDLRNKMQYLYYHQEKDSILSKVNNAKLFTWESVAKNYFQTLAQIVLDTRKPTRIK